MTWWLGKMAKVIDRRHGERKKRKCWRVVGFIWTLYSKEFLRVFLPKFTWWLWEKVENRKVEIRDMVMVGRILRFEERNFGGIVKLDLDLLFENLKEKKRMVWKFDAK